MTKQSKTLLEEVRNLEMSSLRVDTPDISCRVKETARKYGCGTGLALRLLAARRLALYQHEGYITEDEIDSRLRQARVPPDSEGI